MALRDRLQKPERLANPAILANLTRPEPRESQQSQQSQPVHAPQPQRATPAEAATRAELTRIMGADHPDFAEALALALADPDTALQTLRVTTSQNVPEAIADDLDELRQLASRYHDLKGDWIPEGALALERLKRIPLANVARELAEYRRLVAQEGGL